MKNQIKIISIRTMDIGNEGQQFGSIPREVILYNGSDRIIYYIHIPFLKIGTRIYNKYPCDENNAVADKLFLRQFKRAFDFYIRSKKSELRMLNDIGTYL